MNAMPETREIEHLEMRLLLEGIYQRYGYDFRDYAPGSIRRRIRKRLAGENLESVSELQHRLLCDPDCMTRLLLDVSINVTGMFRDPHVYLALREKIVPTLRTYPHVRIWIAGCATGEEVYSVAIVLHEEGLGNRSRIYATDINEAALAKAKDGIFPLKKMQQYTRDYQKAGGTSSFSDYYTASHDDAVLRPKLRENIVFAPHNLVTDEPFNEFNLVFCRNVMIYFNRQLQDRVFDLFHRSLCRFGYLGLGSKESLKFSPHETCYEEVGRSLRLYKRTK